MYLYIILCYCLQLMMARRYRKMYWKDWERIDKDIEVVPKRQNNLFSWTILLTKEARTLSQRSLINLRSCTHQACRIKLRKG